MGSCLESEKTRQDFAAGHEASEGKSGEQFKIKTVSIKNRRYLGNKYKLLPFISEVVKNNCKGIDTVADIFSGTGSVASAFTDKRIITSDLLYSNYICNYAWFGSQTHDKEKIIELITAYNSMTVDLDNYMSDKFADTYFSLADCRKIGYIREDIEARYAGRELNEKERALLITSLLYAMDRIASTCGHYDAYRRDAVYDKHLELCLPEVEDTLAWGNTCYNENANELVKRIYADLVYIDPPYNSRQYSDTYHLLENVALWQKPEVYGVAKKMDRRKLKSDYCTKAVERAFESLIKSIDARYILLSYNNMASKGNDRSNARISDETIMRVLKARGTVEVFEKDYKAFSAGKSDIKGNKERLFLCTCFSCSKKAPPCAGAPRR